MSRDPFLRLALIALCSVYVLGLWLVAQSLDVLACFAVALGGAILAGSLTAELTPKKPDTDRRRRQRQPAEGTRGFERIE